VGMMRLVVGKVTETRGRGWRRCFCIHSFEIILNPLHICPLSHDPSLIELPCVFHLDQAPPTVAGVLFLPSVILFILLSIIFFLLMT
jgi:hypothetical protein